MASTDSKSKSSLRKGATDEITPEEIEAASLLQRINIKLAVEEALIADLMKRRGL